MMSQTHPMKLVPRFQLTQEHTMRPEIVACASAVMLALVGISLYVTGLPARSNRMNESSIVERSPAGSQGNGGAVGSDDSATVDTLVFGDSADPQHHAVRSTDTQVHPTLVGYLQRFGDGPGLLPDTPAGHLMYAWLVAFNHSDLRAMSDLLPPGASSLTNGDLLELRRRNGGFDVVGAKGDGLDSLVFVLREESSPNALFSGKLVMSSSMANTMRSFTLKELEMGMEVKPEGAAAAMANHHAFLHTAKAR